MDIVSFVTGYKAGVKKESEKHQAENLEQDRVTQVTDPEDTDQTQDPADE